MGSYTGSIAGSLVMVVLSNALTTMGFSQPLRNIFMGLIMVLLLIFTTARKTSGSKLTNRRAPLLENRHRAPSDAGFSLPKERFHGNPPPIRQPSRASPPRSWSPPFSTPLVNSISSVLLNEVVAAFSLTGAAQGLLSSMLSVGYMLALLVNPLFQGRTEKLFMLLLSGLMQVAMLLLSGSASSFAVFLTAIVLLGVGCGWLDGYINSCMIDFHPHDSPKYLSLLHGLFGVGSCWPPC